MAHAFAPIPAKPAFGTLKENLYQSDYINRKKAEISFKLAIKKTNATMHLARVLDIQVFDL